MSNEKEIQEGNIIIADFIGWDKYQDGVTYKVPNLFPYRNIDHEENTGWTSENISQARFHQEWDWLMHAIEKIIRIPYKDNEPDLDYPYPRTFGMLDNDTGWPMVRFNRQPLFISETLLMAAWHATVAFIKWHNTQPPSQG